MPTFVWDGATAMIFSSLTTVKLEAGISPNITALAPFRLVTGDGHFFTAEDGAFGRAHRD